MRGIAGTGSLFAILCLPFLPSGNSVAAVFQCPAADVTCLITSIHMANANGDSDTIQLASGTYSLIGVDNVINGPNGLPSITTPITIVGAGAESTAIQRAADAPPFRILHVVAAGALTLDSLTIRNGLLPEGEGGAIEGGGIRNSGGTLNIANVTVADNVNGTAAERILTGLGTGGGVASLGGSVTITHSSIRDNRGSRGGGGIAILGGTLTLAHSTIMNNVGRMVGDTDANFGRGGGLYIRTFGADLAFGTITDSTFANNEAWLGGGLAVQGHVVRVTSTTMRDNRALQGGGVGNLGDGGELSLANSTIVHNQAAEGAGVFNLGLVRMKIVDSTVANNVASFDFGRGANFDIPTGGGVLNFGSFATLVNVTISGNSAGQGGGIFHGRGDLNRPFSLQNTLIGDNAPSDCASFSSDFPITSLGNNLIEDLPLCEIVPQSTDLSGPTGLGPYTDDGMPGNGHFSLLSGSRAIDAGNAEACSPADQLGQPRVAVCDIGAIEFQAEAVIVSIDVKPGSARNVVNLKSRGVIPVAILTTDTFDATSVVPESVRFGPNAAMEAHGRGHIEDVNRDGRPDLVLHFRTQETGIQCSDQTVQLTGETAAGGELMGSDTITTVGCGKDAA
jgi:hypothetical protein